MCERHKENRNLSIFTDTQFNNKKIYQNKSGPVPMIKQYLNKIEVGLDTHMQQYTRTFVVRVDLHFPKSRHGDDSPLGYDPGAITRFICSLRAKINYSIVEKNKVKERVHSTKVNYMWGKEQDSSSLPHYHLALMFNGQAYRSLGSPDYPKSLESLIKQAWASALSIELIDVEGLAYFPNNCSYFIDTNKEGHEQVYREVFERLSYLAKSKTKEWCKRGRSFSSSRI